MIEQNWEEKWRGRSKIMRHDTEAGIRKWITKNMDDYEEDLFFDWHVKDGFVAYKLLPLEMVTPEASPGYAFAAGSMAFMLLCEANELNLNMGYHEEIEQWIESFDEEAPDASFMAFLTESLEVELREGWELRQFKKPDFIAKLAAYIGDGYENVAVFQIIKEIHTRIQKEDEADVHTDSNEEQ